MKWKVQGLRATFFPPRVSPIDVKNGESWWSVVTGEPPAEEARKPREQLYEAKGPFELATLGLGVQPFRVDWQWYPEMHVDATEISNLGDVGSMMSFANALDRWLPLCGAVSRLALGAVFVSPVENRVDGYKAIARFLPSVRLDPENSSDFLYQINRPRMAVHLNERLTINRLSRWGVMEVVPLTVEVSPQVGQSAAVGATGAPLSALRLELDVNTAADRRDALPPESLGPLFRELIDSALEISDRGDVS